uniref:DH domain-containing protein n=1 Tax=Clastoptera arizonana TaxID=38151 RepID=A0A1B6DCI2_9HEMI
MDPVSPQSSLSQDLRLLLNQRNILSCKTKSKVIEDLDNHISNNEEKRNLYLRSKIIDEIITSELSYLNQLEKIIQYFKEPLQNDLLYLPKILKNLFGNLEPIYKVNVEFSNQLQANRDNIAVAFLNLAPFFKLYSSYAYGYKYALASLQDLLQTNSKFNELVRNQESRPEIGCKLSSLLITPIQRIPRYRLLLRELLSKTESTHPHYSVLKDALSEIGKVTEHINGLVKELESMHRLIDIQRCFKGGNPIIISPGRKLIKEGRLLKVSRNGNLSQECYNILLTDSFLYCKIKKHLIDDIAIDTNSLECCFIFPLKKCSVELVLSHSVFKLSCNGEIMIFYSHDYNLIEEWVKAIITEKKKIGLTTVGKKSSAQQPLCNKESTNQNIAIGPHKNQRCWPRKRKSLNHEETTLSINETDVSQKKKIKIVKNLQEESQKNKHIEANHSQLIPSKSTSYGLAIKSLFQRVGESIHQYFFPFK